MPPPFGSQDTNAAIRRSSSRLGINTQELSASKNEVTNAVSARKYLERTALAISGKPYATDNLSDILFHITQLNGVSLPAQTAIRAVAFLLEESAALETADNVAKLVITAIAPHIAKIHEASEQIALTSSQLIDTKTTMNDISSNISNNSADSIIGTASIDSRLDKMQQAVTSLTTQVKESSQQGGYKAVLLSGQGDNGNLNSQGVQRAARDAIKARQILIELTLDSPLAPGKVTHAQLVDKIKATIKTLQNENAPELEVCAVSQFRNGGTVIEMLTAEGATYLKREDIKGEFINTLDPKAMIKERAYLVVIQFAPITFDPSSSDQLRDLEQENGWERGAITMARWIKPPGKRTNIQQVAHIIASPNTANEGIRDGITLNQTRLQIRKNKREPIHCAKCQHYGHIARDCISHKDDCISHKDTCANCAEEHRTSECTNKNRHCCISCKSDNHASWDRRCPEFERHGADLDSRQPENTMPYYPTDDSWTQVQAPPKASPYVRTPMTQQLEEPPCRNQDTLVRHLAPRGRGGPLTRGGMRPNYHSPPTRIPPNQDKPNSWNTPAPAPSTFSNE